MGWYNRVVKDISALPDAIAYYEQELLNARKEVGINGNIEKNLSQLPGVTEYRFGQLQEIEAILGFLEIELRKIKRKHFQKYLEKYNRALTSRDAEKYTDGEPEVIDFQILINEIALMRNKFLGIMKGLDQKSWQLGHIVRIRAAGMEDMRL